MKSLPCLRLALLLALATIPAARLHAQALRTGYEGATALGLELRRLGTTKRALMIGAHPDDERTEVLTALALGSGAEVAYLSLTRGEGGQNAIGPELLEGLGLIRSEELLTARRIDGARQYFARAIDFGFSKNAEEASLHWPHEALLGDVVATIRHFRPDIVIAVFSGTPADGHGQHQLSGILAREAFTAAADPSRFPEQIAAGLRPFAPSRLYQSAGGYIGGGIAGASTAAPPGPTSQVITGDPDPLLGDSTYAQVAARSRTQHRSQGIGGGFGGGPVRVLSLPLAAGVAVVPGAGPFAGLDTTFSARAEKAGGATARAAGALRDYEQRVAPLAGARGEGAPADLVARLAGALRALTVAEPLAADPELRERIAAERAEAEAALWRAQGVTFDAVASDETVVPGQRFTLDLSVRNAGARPVRVQALEPKLPAGWTAVAAVPLAPALAPGATTTRRFTVTVPANAAPTAPYFLRTPRRGDMYVWPAGVRVGLPFDPPLVRGTARVAIADVAVPADQEAFAPRASPGAVERPVRVVAPVSVLLDPGIIAIPLGTGAATQPLKLDVRLLAEAPQEVSGTLSLRAPAGWRVEPARLPVRLAPGESRVVQLTATPPAGLATGEMQLAAVFESGGAEYTGGYTLIDYPHIRPEPLPRLAAARVRAFDVRVPAGLRVGYVAGSGDDAARALRQLGVDVTELTDEQLASADLSRFGAILLGIRAYEVRPDTVRGALVRNNARILEYARNGGTLVVQYFRFENAPREAPALPFPLTAVLQSRITDERAPVRLLAPEHPALSSPNRIGEGDFAGWVQERGLYYPREWGPELTPLLEMADPGEAPQRGAILVAPYGKGTFVYTGLSLFRQFPEGVPGAYRLLANLVSLGVR